MANKLTMGQRLAALFTGQVPTKKLTRYSYRGELPAIAQALDVDRVHAILRAAEAGNVLDLFALYRDVITDDLHIQGEFNKRKLAVLGDPFALAPVDKKNAADVAARDFCQDQIDGCEDFFRGCNHLLDSALWPVTVLEKVFRPASKPGVRFELAELVPVPMRLLEYSNGHLQLRGTEPATGVPTGELFDVDLNRYIVHRGHLLNQPDNWGGPMRALLFWWLLANMDRDWWARYLDRSNSPFLLGKYDQNDDQSRTILERAFSLATKLGGLVVSKQTEVDIKNAASTETADGYEKFHALCRSQLSSFITGQGSMEGQKMQIGEGPQKQQERVRQDIRAFDALMLGATLRTQLFDQLLRINALPGRAPKPLWGAESYENARVIGELLAKLKEAGLEPSDDALVLLQDRLGFGIQRSLLPAGQGFPLSAELLLLSALGKRDSADRANLEVCRRAAAPLAQAFRGHLAPVRQIILTSRSPEDLESKLQLLYSDWSAERLRPLLESALAAQSANAAL